MQRRQKTTRKCQKASATHQSMRMNVVTKKKNCETMKSPENLLDTTIAWGWHWNGDGIELYNLHTIYPTGSPSDELDPIYEFLPACTVGYSDFDFFHILSYNNPFLTPEVPRIWKLVKKVVNFIHGLRKFLVKTRKCVLLVWFQSLILGAPFDRCFVYGILNAHTR